MNWNGGPDRDRTDDLYNAILFLCCFRIVYVRLRLFINVLKTGTYVFHSIS